MAKVRRMAGLLNRGGAVPPQFFRLSNNSRFPVTLAPTLRHNPSRTQGCSPQSSTERRVLFDFQFRFSNFRFFGSSECPTDHGVPPHLRVNSAHTFPPTKT